MRMYDIIYRKRMGYELSDDEIKYFIEGYTKDIIPDYQASALAMAICFNGMTERETVTLTQCIAESGETVDLSCFGDLSADKHSTGGVGDKTSLIVAPIVAAAGCKVAKMTGRGLGHTGGTADKLESIPGFKISLSPYEFTEQVKKTGIAVVGQNKNLTPADKKLYALRDVTATVDSVPLITSSIMGKKLASGAKNIVLDVKFGSGAFMKTVNDAKILAENMVSIGKKCGRNTAAIISNMDMPLGYAIGNSIEVREAIEVLRGESVPDLRLVCETLASVLISLTFKIPENEAAERVRFIIDSGAAYEKFKEWITSQGGRVGFVENPSKLPIAAGTYELRSLRDGYITSMNAEKIGKACMLLGAGRANKDDIIDYGAGIKLKKKTGDRVNTGDVLCRMYTNRESSIEEAEKLYRQALTFGNTAPDAQPTVVEICD